MPQMTRTDWGVLVALTLLGVALRAYRLDAPLWYDEILTLLDFARLPVDQIVTTYTSLNNHIFFSLQAHAAMGLFGESAWSLRLPAAAFGAATVPLLWVLIRVAGLPRAVAGVAALLLALNYHHIWFSQNARGYTGLVFWCLAALMCVILGRKGAGRWAWAGVAVSGALAMYTHLSAAFFLAGLFLSGFLAELGGPAGKGARLRAHFWAFAGMAVLVLLMYLPIMDDILATMTEVAAPADAAKPNTLEKWENPLLALGSALAELPGPTVLAMIALPVAFVFFLAGWLLVYRADRVLAWSIPMGILVTVALLMLAGMRIWPRYFLIDIVLFLLLATTGVLAIVHWIDSKDGAGRWLVWTGWAFGIAISALWGAQNYAKPKQDFAGAIAAAESAAEPGDAFASFGLSALPIGRYYRPDWTMLDQVESLDNLMVRPGKTWIVLGFEDHSRANHPAIFERLDASFERVEKRVGSLGDGTVLVYRSRGDANASD